MVAAVGMKLGSVGARCQRARGGGKGLEKLTGAAIPVGAAEAWLQRGCAIGAVATTGASMVAARAGRGCQMMWGSVIAIARV